MESTKKELGKLCKGHKIKGAIKVRGHYDIPNNTVMIVCDCDILGFLLLTIKVKNSPGTVIPASGFETTEKRHVWYDYLIDQGLIGPTDYVDDMKQLMTNTQLTDRAFEIIFSQKKYDTLVKITIQPSDNLSLLHIG